MVEVLYISWQEVVDLCYRLASKVLRSGYEPDAIVAILRGGVVPALLLSDMLAVENFYAMRVKHWGIARELYDVPVVEQLPQARLQGSSVLLVDEVADTGKTLARAVEELRRLGVSEVKTAVLHVKPTSSFEPDYYAGRLDKWAWIFYPWSFAETLIALAYKELGPNAGREALLRKIEELVKALEVENYRRDLLEYALSFYAKRLGEHGAEAGRA